MEIRLNELREQRRLIEDIKAQDPQAMAWKCSNRFLAGVPDLRIAVPNQSAFWLEIKVEKWPSRGIELPVNLTALQRHWLKRAITAGEIAGWAVIVERPDRDLGMYVGMNPDVDKIPTILSPLSTIRKRVGGRWALKFLVEYFK